MVVRNPESRLDGPARLQRARGRDNTEQRLALETPSIAAAARKAAPGLRLLESAEGRGRARDVRPPPGPRGVRVRNLQTAPASRPERVLPGEILPEGGPLDAGPVAVSAGRNGLAAVLVGSGTTACLVRLCRIVDEGV